MDWSHGYWFPFSPFVRKEICQNQSLVSWVLFYGKLVVKKREHLWIPFIVSVLLLLNRLQISSRQYCFLLETHQPTDRSVKHQGDQQAHVTTNWLDLLHRFLLHKSSCISATRFCRSANLQRITRIAVRHHDRAFHERRRRTDHSERTDRHALPRDLSTE